MKLFNLNKSIITCINGRKIPQGAIYGDYKGMTYYVVDINTTKIIQRKIRLENGKFDTVRIDTTRFYGYVYAIPRHRKGDTRKPLDHCIWFKICLPLELCNELRTKFDKYDIQELNIHEFDENSSHKNNQAIIDSLKPHEKRATTEFSIRPHSQSMVDGKNWNMHEEYAYDDAPQVKDENVYYHMLDNRIPNRESMKVTIKDYHPKKDANSPKTGDGNMYRTILEKKIKKGAFSAVQYMHFVGYERNTDKIVEYFKKHNVKLLELKFNENLTSRKEFNMLNQSNCENFKTLKKQEKINFVNQLISYAKQFNM